MHGRLHPGQQLPHLLRRRQRKRELCHLRTGCQLIAIQKGAPVQASCALLSCTLSWSSQIAPAYSIIVYSTP